MKVLEKEKVKINQKQHVNGVAYIPGSKSYTNRALIIAALTEGMTTINHALLSEDIIYLANAIKEFGVEVSINEEKAQIVVNRENDLIAPKDPVFLGNAGTPVRLLTTVASLAVGTTTITGNERMQERPIADLTEALNPLGVHIKNVNDTGCPPIEVTGPTLTGGKTNVNGTVSSQYTSSLLLSAPFAQEDVEIEIVGELTSKPYVDMTVGIMEEFGVEVQRKGYKWFKVKAGQKYVAREYTVEPDASNMSYYLGIASLTRGRIKVPGINMSSLQGDVKFIDVLEKMGICVEKENDFLAVRGKDMTGINVDMNLMPDLVPTLAVLAAYAKGRTHIYNIANLRIKECDRIKAMEDELGKMGIKTESTKDTLTVYGGEPSGAEIHTYDDHRIAMAFAIAGLRTPGVEILDPNCVSKSFPTYWEVFKSTCGEDSIYE